ncbi:MAG: DNA mismatch repair endonuclease MutL [Clostridiales bacterium]|jgi:DNA mismatch repair protein MutL|nr:DNA mismatch repair endonuclease MutL [Clostridiales bacterium]
MKTNQIQLLDADMINKIAAGEVVERPLSVVKELVENSIDAGASAITIEIKDGGVTQTRVTDNGCGIPQDQTCAAFWQHATSKIAAPDDLTRVMTLGFRGEALASVAAVARVEMITKTAGAILGSRLEVHGSEIAADEEIGCAEGTTVIVRDLFYNVPVRLKFLKKPASEAGAISDIVNKLALGHPEIAFQYISNGTTALRTNGNGDLKTAIFYVYGRETAQKLLPVEARAERYTLTGFLAKPELSRGSRNYQTVFINGRYVKTELLQSAVEDAYKTLVMTGKFPTFVLHLSIEPDLVDVNVHPNKLEVRFREEESLFAWTRAAALAALQDQNLIPTAKPERLLFHRAADTKILEPAKTQAALPFHPSPKSAPKTVYTVKENDRVFAPVPEHVPDQIPKPVPTPNHEPPQADPHPSEPAPSAPAFRAPYRIIGQVFQTYWMAEQNESLYIIDQHAAHERILYEELLKSLKQESIPSQQLLRPIAVQLSFRERQLLEDNQEMFERFGFEIEDFGGQSAAIRAVPFLFKNPMKADFLLDILDKLEKDSAFADSGPIEPGSTEPAGLYQLKLNAIASMACKAAVKANDSLSPEEARALIEKMLSLEHPFTCPHGRPTVIEMTKRDFEKKFKRV